MLKLLTFLLIIGGTAGLILYFERDVITQWGVFRHVTENTFLGSALGGMLMGFILLVARR